VGQHDPRGLVGRRLVRVEQVVRVERGAVGQVDRGQHLAEQRVPAQRAQLVLDGTQHLQPPVRRIRERQRLAGGLGVVVTQLGAGPGVRLLRRDAGRADEVDDPGQLDQRALVPERGRQVVPEPVRPGQVGHVGQRPAGVRTDPGQEVVW
jgi:hypothetical protein